jgi:hypothetical protein
MKLRLIIAFLCLSPLLFSQEVDSLAQDSVPKHSIKKAVYLSAIIPGSGQIYNSIHIEKGVKGKNKIFWKIPLIYAVLGTTGFLLGKNQGYQSSLKEEYIYRVANPTLISNPKWVKYDQDGILTLYNKYLSRRDLFTLAFGATYLIQLIDAGIEAHFVKFDLSEDLTFQIKPKLYNFNSMGLGMSFNFHEKQKSSNFKF